MNWTLKNTREKIKSSYKTLYISDSLIESINKIAKENRTSFNNVIISMVESCLHENDNKKERSE